MNEAVEIRAAEVGDVEAIVRLEQGCGEAPQWGDAVWRGLLAEQGLGLRWVLVAEDASGVVGFVTTGGVAGIAELESVAVAAETRGLGVGTTLCREAMRRVAACGARAMELEVRDSNAAARRMYAGLGFVEQGVRKGYYQGPVEDAVLMSTVLAGS